MESGRQRIDNEPALGAGAAVAVVALGVAYAADVSAEGLAWIVAVVAVGAAFAVRHVVHGPRTIDDVLDAEAVLQGATAAAADDPIELDLREHHVHAGTKD